MTEYRTTVAIAELGRDEDNAVRVLEAFERVHPEVGAVTAVNLAAGTLELVFSLEAESLEDAVLKMAAVFHDGMVESGMDGQPLVGASVEAVPVDELEPELIPA